MRPLVYVAGPITGDPWGCVRRATDVARQLSAEGIDAYLPQLSVLREMVDPQPYEHWINHGLNMVARCDGLYRLSGESPGADLEVKRAAELSLPIWDETEPFLHAFPVSWWLDAVRAQATYRSES